MNSALSKVDTLLAERKIKDVLEELRRLFNASARDRALQGELFSWVIAHVGDEHPQLGADIALFGGALVEAGAAAGPFGKALIAPIERALVDAARMLVLAQNMGAELSEDGGVQPDKTSHVIAGRVLSKEDLHEITAHDAAAVRAWFSLERWYMPAVAAWTRDLGVLHDVRARASLREAIARVHPETATGFWLSLLFNTMFATPLTVLIPEIDEVWSLVADGVADLGQLTILLSKELSAPLSTIGASGVASPAVLEIMRGHGPQEINDGYSSSFRFYPIEATDPGDGLPRDGVEWTAPGGTGTHSYPADFQPGTINAIDGIRYLVMVGPKAPGVAFTRVINAARMFDAIEAKISGVKKLPADQAQALFQLARARGATATRHENHGT